MRESSTLPSPPSCPTVSVATRTAATNYCVTPAYVAQVAKGEACREFRSERAFYYAQKGDQLISPEQQAEITTIFNEYELPAPQFDSYEQRPDWKQ
jgi:hypothetical protein